MGSCSSNQVPLPVLLAVTAMDINVPVETKREIANLYADKVGMDAANKKGFEVLATEGSSAMFAHMVKESGGDYSRMMAMYH
jgi:hypothetical protein